MIRKKGHARHSFRGTASYNKKFYMEQMNDLRALLKHDVQMLCSVEDQIIEALPAMIGRASSNELKQT